MAPHPDDATLIAAGVIARAVRDHEGVAVAFMTNGDLTCARDGIQREDESIRALGELGLDEEHVYFLGYPDGYLARMGRSPLSPVERRIDGRCERGDETYAVRGHDHRDVHSLWFGRSATYTADNAVADLSALLESLHPQQIVVTHPMDVHPDHAATYALLRRALANTNVAATIHRAFVHAGDCWPLGPEPTEPCSRTVIDPSAPFPPLFGALSDYHFSERIPVPDDFLQADVDTNPKLRAIRDFHSQLRPSPLETYLFSFARRDETFFVESPESCGPSDNAGPCAAHTAHAMGVLLTSHAPLRSLEQGLPLDLALDWPRSPPPIEILANEDGAYRFGYDANNKAAVLTRIDRGEPRTVKAWLLPDDLWTTADREHVELRFDARPGEGDAVEVSLLLRHQLVGVAVDVHARHAGQNVRADFETSAPPQSLAITFFAGAQRAAVRIADGVERPESRPQTPHPMSKKPNPIAAPSSKMHG